MIINVDKLEITALKVFLIEFSSLVAIFFLMKII
jgi:hypothetical protein